MDELIWQVLVALLVVAAIVEGTVLVGVSRQLGTLLLQSAPPRPGGLDGGPSVDDELEIPGLPDDKGAVVIFIAPGCGPCDALKPSIPVVARHYQQLEVTAAVVAPDEGERRRYAAEFGAVGRSDLNHLYEEWEIPGTPFAVGVDRAHRVRRTGVVNTLDQLEALAESVLAPVPVDGGAEEKVEPAASGNGHVPVEQTSTTEVSRWRS